MKQEELLYIFQELRDLLKEYEPPLVAKLDIQGRYELWSEKEVEIAERMRKELYFSGIIIQSSYVGFYFMPIYAEIALKDIFSPELLKLLKGKSCFHIKKWDDSLRKDIQFALKKGFDLYRGNGWV